MRSQGEPRLFPLVEKPIHLFLLLKWGHLSIPFVGHSCFVTFETPDFVVIGQVTDQDSILDVVAVVVVAWNRSDGTFPELVVSDSYKSHTRVGAIRFHL